MKCPEKGCVGVLRVERTYLAGPGRKTAQASCKACGAAFVLLTKVVCRKRPHSRGDGAYSLARRLRDGETS